MSDLHRAVQDEIAAFTPPAAPPFETITARKRARDRRRLATGSAALGAVALLAAVAVPSLSNGGSDRLPSYVSPAPPAADFAVPDGYTPEYRPGAWITESVSADRRTVTVRVAGGGCASYGTHDVDSTGDGLRLHVWNEVLVPQDDRHGCRLNFTDAPVTVDLPRALGPGEALLGGCDDPTAGADTDTCQVLRGTVPADRADGLAWTGATICLGADDACRSLDAGQAQRLDAVLDTAVPAPPDRGYCRAAGQTYTVRFEHPTARAVPITVRALCGPMEQGGAQYLLDKAGQDQVEAIYRAAATGPPDDGGLSSARVTGLDVGDSTTVTLAAPCGVPPLLVDGVPYLATSYAAAGDSPPGWDAEEQGQLRRTTSDSMIFVADEGTVRIQFLRAPGRHLQGCHEQWTVPSPAGPA